ncbi:extracellular solute-binding protein [Haloarcula onubensis]|uniref:Extracellular solute-binding protein n=1 Tax=Haloarcula onubensis TaxID=2950539 RepID=A0ABU2FWH0_9EURY|nr:extracellular solute-binding protein [Halomicroarcula sp. S3CR25-11]MDS0284627.1 extracellular solute-binding protein [Halomicroarcula sp. S3CR25-11]
MRRDVAGPSRRALLSALPACVLAGCSGALGGGETVSMLVAGSLNDAVENGLRPAVDTRLQSAAHGSAEVARLVADGAKDPDIVTLADVALFDALLSAEWVAEFATNALVVVYDPDTVAGDRLAGGAPWYEVLLDDDVSLGRTDPDVDPLGYRTLFCLALATDHYGTDRDLREAVPRPDQRYPETQLVSQFETGAIDVAIAYRNMAEARGYDYVDLPPEIDLSDPALADRYGAASYELPDGTVVSGDVISYGSTLRHDAPPTRDVFETHTTGAYLTEFGFTVPDDYPRYRGNVPDGIAN